MKLPSPAVLKSAITIMRTLANIFESMLDQPQEDMVIADPAPKRKSTHKATIEEMRAFCKSIAVAESDGDYFFHKNEAEKWPKNWQAKIRSWKSCGYRPSQKAGVTQAPKPAPKKVTV